MIPWKLETGWNRLKPSAIYSDFGKCDQSSLSCLSMMRDHMWSVPCLHQWYEGCEMMWISSSVQYPDQHLSRQFQGNEEAAKHVTHVQLHKNLTMTVRLMAIQMPLLRNFFAATPFHHLQWLTASDFFFWLWASSDLAPVHLVLPRKPACNATTIAMLPATNTKMECKAKYEKTLSGRSHWKYCLQETPSPPV